MTNLDRLKGTPYLMDGLESFIRQWLAPIGPNEAPLPWADNEKEMKLFGQLPDEVQEFYQIIHRWPDAGIQAEEQDRLFCPPHKFAYWDEAKQAMLEDEESDRVALVVENQALFVISMSIAEKNFGTLYTNADESYDPLEDDEYREMTTPVGEFLVTFALREMISSRWDSASEPDYDDQSVTLFTGSYHADLPMEIRCDAEGTLWLMDENGRPYFGAQKS